MGVFNDDGAGGDNVNVATWGGQNMTLVGKCVRAIGMGWAYLYEIQNPISGGQVVIGTSNTSYIGGLHIGYYRGLSPEAKDASNTAVGNTVNLTTCTVTSVSDDTVLIGYGVSDNGGCTLGNGGISRLTSQAVFTMGDSACITKAGAKTIDIKGTGNGHQLIIMGAYKIVNTPDLRKGLAAYLPMREKRGTIFSDVIAGRAAPLIAGTLLYDTGPFQNTTAAKFTGGNYAEKTTPWVLMNKGELTISWLMKSTNKASNQGLVNCQGTVRNFINIQLDTNGNINTEIGCVGFSNIAVTTSGQDCADGKWHLVTVVFTNTTQGNIETFIDGVSRGTVSAGAGIYNVLQSMARGYSIAMIRNWWTGAVQTIYTGQLAEIGVWNRALSSAEVGMLYNNGKFSSYPFNAYNPAFLFFTK